MKVSAKAVQLEGEEQLVAVLIPDPDLLEALDEWAKNNTEHDIAMPKHLGTVIATLLDLLDEQLNPESEDEDEHLPF